MLEKCKTATLLCKLRMEDQNHQKVWMEIQNRRPGIYEILIPNTLLATEAPYHLLLAQLWEQQSTDTVGIYCII